MTLPLVFLTGAAVLILEILGTRVISPFYGATVYVWSALIVVTLASLAAGYALGGALADRASNACPKGAQSHGPSGPRDRGKPRAGVCAMLACSGGWLLLVQPLRRPVLLAASSLGVQAGALASAAALFAVPLVCLGAVGPLCIRLRTEALDRLGREVGWVNAVSTAGSVAGALLAGFWLVPRLPVSASLLALAAALLGAALLFGWSLLRRGTRIAALSVAALGVGLSAAAPSAPRPAGESLRERARSFYGDIRVVDRPFRNRRTLFIDGVANTVAALDTLDSTSRYIMAFEALPLFRPAAKKALMIGLGGGALVGRFREHYGVATDVVEIDPVIERLARTWFAFEPSGRVSTEDGRMFLERSGEAYDFIVIDAFNGDQHPYHLFSKEAFAAASRRLSPGGVLAINAIGFPDGPRDGLKRSMAATLGAVFRHVRVAAAREYDRGEDDCVNMMFFASDAPLAFARPAPAGRPELAAYAAEFDALSLETGVGVVSTDDRNPIEALSAPAFAAMRRDLWSVEKEGMAD
jgi:spermidine synthase